MGLSRAPWCAVGLGHIFTFVERALWLAFVDNDGLLHALTKGRGGGPESCACIGRLWLELAYCQTDLHCGRVESEANIADGPTRDQFEFAGQLKATWVNPKILIGLRICGNVKMGIELGCEVFFLVFSFLRFA